MLKRLIFLALAIGAILFLVFRPDDARALWNFTNIKIKQTLGGNPNQYTPPKGYFMDAPLVIYRWEEPGKIVELSDFSRWELRDLGSISRWGISQEIEISYSSDPEWPYTLRNTDRPSQSAARFRGQTRD